MPIKTKPATPFNGLGTLRVLQQDNDLNWDVQIEIMRSGLNENGWDYRNWAMETAGVGEVKVVELKNGPGTVGLTIVDSNYQGASEDIVEAVDAKGETIPFTKSGICG